MDKLSKNLDKFYSQIHNNKNLIRSTSKDSNDPSNTSIDLQKNYKKQEKNAIKYLKED